MTPKRIEEARTGFAYWEELHQEDSSKKWASAQGFMSRYGEELFFEIDRLESVVDILTKTNQEDRDKMASELAWESIGREKAIESLSFMTQKVRELREEMRWLKDELATARMFNQVTVGKVTMVGQPPYPTNTVPGYLSNRAWAGRLS